MSFKKYEVLLCVGIALLNFQTKASGITVVPKVIYGKDDRSDLYQSGDNQLIDYTRSTAAQIPNELLLPKGENFILTGRTLKETGVCSYERFSSQLTSADCSGFLIAPDTLVTAGHCVQNLSDCKNNYWVFDYANNKKEESFFSFSKNQLFRCVSIVAHEFSGPGKSDFSIVKLDKIAIGRPPLKYRNSGRVESDAALAVIGHPSGLPSKITTSVEVRDNSKDAFFTTNSDTYSGSSGAAVINTKTGLVEGILIRGDVDYVQVEGSPCRISKINPGNAGRGEDVMRITAIPFLK